MLVLPFAYHVNPLNTGQNRLCLPERFESRHQLYPVFDLTVILLHKMAVSGLTMPDFGWRLDDQ